ncbi:MAG: hypothetical protein J1E80_07470 [Desulfovibrionaceae bacterium]|nr:hypothetical protein [Desulfovibrionaceae bacterium]
MHMYPRFTGKLIVLLGGCATASDFRHWYLNEHAPGLAERQEILEYRANIISDSEMAALTRDTNGGDPYGVRAVDEIKGARWETLKDLYKESELIGAYSVTEYMVREFYPIRPVGVMSPEIKRIALLTKPVNKTHDDAMKYWVERHPEFCFRHHTGMASYSQNHIDRILTDESIPLDGFPILAYWNDDALRYGHFSREDTKALMLDDCSHFRSTSFVITVDEYVMKRPPNWREKERA